MDLVSRIINDIHLFEIPELKIIVDNGSIWVTSVIGTPTSHASTSSTIIREANRK
jgi:hypothetical protein